MRGKQNGVQNRLLQKNPRALYTPCGCYSLNLALCDMVNYCPKAVFFWSGTMDIFIVLIFHQAMAKF